MLGPDDRLSAWSAAGYSNTIDNGQEEEDERLSVFDPKSLFPEGSMLFWSDENLQDLSDPLVEDENPRWSPRRRRVAPAEALTGEDYGNDHHYEKEQAESDGDDLFNADRSDLGYECYDNEEYDEEDMPRLDGDSFPHEDPNQAYEVYHGWIVEDYSDNHEWKSVESILTGGYAEDGGMSREESEYGYNNGLDSHDGCRSPRVSLDARYLRESDARYAPGWVYATHAWSS